MTTLIPPSKVAISYARFSSLKQGDGDSIRRQTEAAEAYAAAHDLIIDRTLSCADEGFSAFDQSNIRKGALGVLLRAIDDGRVPVGATLIVESFDRLSRAEPIDALPVFTDIVNAGLNLAILTSPPKVFSRDSIRANVFLLFEAILDIYRSNSESQRKKELLTKAWGDKKQRAKLGQVMTTKAPHWIDVVVDPNLDKKAPGKRTASLNPERAAIVMRLVEGAERGIGNHTLIRQLHADNVPAWSSSGRWQPSYMQKVLRNPALYGAIELDGEVIEGHYPALIDKERFMYLQTLRSARATTKNTNRGGKLVTNLFSGRLRCGYCGSTMTVSGYKTLKTGYERKYLGCQGARVSKTTCKLRMWFMDELEPKLLIWLTGLDYTKLFGGSKSTLDGERKALAGIQAELAEVRRKAENISAAVAEGEAPKSLLGMLRKLEEQETLLTQTFDTQDHKVRSLMLLEGSGKTRMAALIAAFRTLRLAQGDEVKVRSLREELSAAVAETVQRVTMYPAGPVLTGAKSQRYLVVELKNGKTYTVDDFDTEQDEHDEIDVLRINDVEGLAVVLAGTAPQVGQPATPLTFSTVRAPI